jgi:hypothetical protein
MSSEPCDAGVVRAETAECWETEGDEEVPDYLRPCKAERDPGQWPIAMGVCCILLRVLIR